MVQRHLHHVHWVANSSIAQQQRVDQAIPRAHVGARLKDSPEAADSGLEYPLRGGHVAGHVAQLLVIALVLQTDLIDGFARRLVAVVVGDWAVVPAVFWRR